MSGHFHRRYGEVSYVTVTFYGNGGLTSSSESVVALKVRRGTLFKDIVKPEFFQSGTVKIQNGFTFVQNDDDTVVESSYAVRSDMTVYASFVAIEIGVVTHNGEIHSASSWAAKYADVNSPYCLYEFSVGFFAFKAGYDPGNLIEFIYFKVSENRVFALRSSFEEGGFFFGSMNQLIAGHYTPPALFPRDPSQAYAGYYPAGAFDDIIYYPDGVTVEAGKIPSALVDWSTFAPISPLDMNILIGEKYGNGEEYTQILEDRFTSLGFTSDALVALRQQHDPFGLGETMYIASMYECSLVAQHADKILSIFDTIDAVIQSSGSWYTPSYIVAAYLPYRPNIGEGFFLLRNFCNVSITGSGNAYVFASNLHVRRTGSINNVLELDTLMYWMLGGVTEVMRGGKNVGSLFLISLSDLF